MPKRISKNVEDIVLIDLKNGLPVRSISKKYDVSLGFISNLKKKNDLVIKKNPGGRPQKLSPNAKRAVKRLIVSGAVDNATEANKAIANTLNINVSNETIRRCLKNSNFKAKFKTKKPLLNAIHKKKRLKFAKTYRNWTPENWKLITWSDETKINRMGSDGRVWTWLDARTGLQERNIQKTMKFGGGSLMVWGCFKGEKLGRLRKINGIMKAVDYIEILKDSYLPSLRKFGCTKRETIFMQNNDPKHTAKITKQWLQNQRIETLEWPPQSPDLNPIENLWSIVKRRIIANKTVPKSCEELWSRVQEEWNNIEPNVLKNLIDSLPKRIKAVIRAKGGYTKY